MDNEWLTVRQAAEYLQVSEATVRRWAKDGIIPKRKIGRFVRFLRAELDAAIKINNKHV